MKHIRTEDYKEADEMGLTELNRWEGGIDHHPMSERLVRFMADHDFNDYNDAMCIKVGGDGDNGEHMMYLMDAFFEMLDKKEKDEVSNSFPNTKTDVNILDVKLEYLPFRKRTQNNFRRYEINTVRDLVKMSETELRNLYHFGYKTILDVKDVLYEYNQKLRD